MRVLRTKEKQYAETKIVHATVRKNVPRDLLDKALVFPYRLHLVNRCYARTSIFIDGKRHYELFSYAQLGYLGAIEAAMKWMEGRWSDEPVTLGSVSFNASESASGKLVHRARASYFDEEAKQWRLKSFSFSASVLHPDDKEHLLKTADLWLKTYLETGKKPARFKQWRHLKLYDNDIPYKRKS